MSLEVCQTIPIELNFHLQKCLEIFDKDAADIIQSKNYKGVNPPRLMPITVKSLNNQADLLYNELIYVRMILMLNQIGNLDIFSFLACFSKKMQTMS